MYFFKDDGFVFVECALKSRNCVCINLEILCSQSLVV